MKHISKNQWKETISNKNNWQPYLQVIQIWYCFKLWFLCRSANNNGLSLRNEIISISTQSPSFILRTLSINCMNFLRAFPVHTTYTALNLCHKKALQVFIHPITQENFVITNQRDQQTPIVLECINFGRKKAHYPR